MLHQPGDPGLQHRPQRERHQPHHLQVIVAVGIHLVRQKQAIGDIAQPQPHQQPARPPARQPDAHQRQQQRHRSDQLGHQRQPAQVEARGEQQVRQRQGPGRQVLPGPFLAGQVIHGGGHQRQPAHDPHLQAGQHAHNGPVDRPLAPQAVGVEHQRQGPTRQGESGDGLGQQRQAGEQPGQQRPAPAGAPGAGAVPGARHNAGGGCGPAVQGPGCQRHPHHHGRVGLEGAAGLHAERQHQVKRQCCQGGNICQFFCRGFTPGRKIDKKIAQQGKKRQAADQPEDGIVDARHPEDLPAKRQVGQGADALQGGRLVLPGGVPESQGLLARLGVNGGGSHCGQHLVVHAACDDGAAQLARGVEVDRLVGQVEQAQASAQQQQGQQRPAIPACIQGVGSSRQAHENRLLYSALGKMVSLPPTVASITWRPALS